MNMAPDTTGRVTTEHAARYEEAGQWVAACFGASNAQEAVVNQTSKITIGPLTTSVDRVMIQEDQSQGQRITAYSLLDESRDAPITVVAVGTSVGHKRIQLLGRTFPVGTILTLRIDKELAPAAVARFAAFSPALC